MLKKTIHNKLVELNELEKKLKDGRILNKYKDDDRSVVVVTDKFLHNSKLITIGKHTRFSIYPNHRHDFIEIAYVYQGEMKQNIEGKEIKLKKGEIIFLNQKIKHKIGMTGENDVIINFLIAPDFFDYIVKMFKNENIISTFLLSTIYSNNVSGEYLIFHVSEVKKIQKLMEEIIEEMYREKISSNVKIQLLMGLLIVELLEHNDFIDSYSEENYDKKIIIDVLKYIDKEYKDANLKEISEKLNQVDYHISRMIKSVTGMTFKALLQEKKLEKAAEFLKNSEMSVENIIKNVGYENATYFYRIFKKKYNMSLKEYRDSNSNKKK